LYDDKQQRQVCVVLENPSSYIQWIGKSWTDDALLFMWSGVYVKWEPFSTRVYHIAVT